MEVDFHISNAIPLNFESCYGDYSLMYLTNGDDGFIFVIYLFIFNVRFRMEWICGDLGYIPSY